jgi:hypothetical protein
MTMLKTLMNSLSVTDNSNLIAAFVYILFHSAFPREFGEEFGEESKTPTGTSTGTKLLNYCFF